MQQQSTTERSINQIDFRTVPEQKFKHMVSCVMGSDENWDMTPNKTPDQVIMVRSCGSNPAELRIAKDGIWHSAKDSDEEHEFRNTEDAYAVLHT
jgi:hypothetical protein